jgi:hypothetical protein
MPDWGTEWLGPRCRDEMFWPRGEARTRHLQRYHVLFTPKSTKTSVAGMGGVETDELYADVDRQSVQYALPVQAKGGRDHLSAVQIEQDMALCAEKFPVLVCRPIAAQFMREDVIALFEFELTDAEVTVRDERHYRLVLPEDLSAEELANYRRAVHA